MTRLYGDIAWVCTQWAEQTHDSARTRPSGGSRWGTGTSHDGPRVCQEGRRLYSYGHHHLLGQLIEHKGQTVALLNSVNYSVSTSNHARQARCAVENAGHRIVYTDGALPPTTATIEGLASTAQVHVEKATRRRHATMAAFDLRNATRRITTAREMARMFELPISATLITPTKLQPLLTSLRGKAVRAMLNGDTSLRDALEGLKA